MDIRKFFFKKPRIDIENYEMGTVMSGATATASTAPNEQNSQNTNTALMILLTDFQPNQEPIEVPEAEPEDELMLPLELEPAAFPFQAAVKVNPEEPTVSQSFAVVHNKYDISLFVNKPVNETIDAINGLLNLIWIPPNGYKFPRSEPRNLSFQREWMSDYKWLAYSAIMDGAYCKYCVLFSLRKGGIGKQPLGQLVTKPYRNWKKAKENYSYHGSREYHKDSILKGEMRSKVEKNNDLSVDLQVSKQRAQLINESKKYLGPIIETIILCGRQGLALRGSKDNGRIEVANSDSQNLINDGNFRALLRFRAKTDEQLNTHLQNCAKNAMYTSNNIQNELIVICHNLIRMQIVDRVNKSQAFAILADETADVSGVEQMSICVRYLEKDDQDHFKICEHFLAFVHASDLTGQGLSKTILDFLESSGIDCTFFFGQGYDGASAMSGEFHGAQAYVAKTHNLALYSHCASHSFNLAVTAACSIPQIKNCLGTIESAYNFFNTPKRQLALEEAIKVIEERRLNKHGTEAEISKTNKKKLKQFCATRWVYQHEAIQTYVELQPFVIEALDSISTSWKDSSSSTSAFQLLAAIKTVHFQCSVRVMYSVHSLALSLSRFLQSENLVLSDAIKLAEYTKTEFEARRENAEESFKKIFNSVEDICNEYGIVINKPRLASRQKHRFNINTENIEDYFRIAIYTPFLDGYITHLNDRFIKHKSILSQFSCLFLSQAKTVDEFSATALFKKYSSVLHDNSTEVWMSELLLWRRRIAAAGHQVNNSLEALDICNPEVFPNIYILLKVLAVLPVTTATSERSFSTLRRLKTYLRSTTGEDRLNGLASMNIHRGIPLEVEDVLKEFLSTTRRVNMLIGQ